MSKKPVRILGLTGGIGAGKSTVSARFALLGAHILDADAVSRRLLDTDGACFAAVCAAFGTHILRADGSIDRAALAKLVFADASARETLEGIVHPAVKTALCDDAARILREDPEALVVFDVPLLIESGMQRLTDAVALVTAPEETRIARICARDGAKPEDARARIAAQMPEQEKRLYADYILDNGGSLSALLIQVDALYALLTERGA